MIAASRFPTEDLPVAMNPHKITFDFSSPATVHLAWLILIVNRQSSILN
jgi:hypothetical protein